VSDAARKPDRQYNPDEVAGILQRAIARQATIDNPLSHDDLASTAREMGVTEEQLEAAIVDELVAREVNADLVARQADAKRKLRSSGAFLGVVALFFALLNLLTGGGIWFHYVVASVGLAVGLQGVRAYFPLPDEKLEKRTRERLVAELAERKRVDEDPMERGARALGASLKAALGSLLENAGEGIREIASDLTGKPVETPPAARPRVAQPQRVAKPPSAEPKRVDVGETDAGEDDDVPPAQRWRRLR
jgi:hypothetical protein